MSLNVLRTGKRHKPRDRRVMWVTPKRVYYAGIVGSPAPHTKGALMIYIGLDAPIRIRVEGGDRQVGNVAIVQPYVSHQVTTDNNNGIGVYIEPETLDLSCEYGLVSQPSGVIDAPELLQNIRLFQDKLTSRGTDWLTDPEQFDELVFGAALTERNLDPRISRIFDQAYQNLEIMNLAENCSNLVNLSCSRFLHLFKDEVGHSFRKVRQWKRARSLLHYVKSEDTLTKTALDVGYPDSAHMSYSIRRCYGLRPRDIVTGCRKLDLVCDKLEAAQIY